MDGYSAPMNLLPDYSSTLHRERMYLISTLASEEARAERYSLALQTTRSKIWTAEHADDVSVDASKNLRKAASGLSRKLKSCQRTQSTMASNLAAVNARILSTEQYRWRKMQFEYQQAQNSARLVMGMQNMGFTSPAQFEMSCTQPQYTPSQMMGSPPLPPLNTQTVYVPSNNDPWGSPLYTPFYEQSQPLLQLSQPQQPDEYSPPAPISWSLIDGAQPNDSFVSVPQYSKYKNRAMSLPATWPPSNRSSERSNSPERIREVGDGQEEQGQGMGQMEMGRRLSSVGGASAGLRLGKLATREST